VLGPDAFINTLARAGLLFNLVERMVDEALEFLADHRHTMPNLSVAVNLELGTVPATGLTGVIGDLLVRHDVRAELLTLKLNARLSYELSDPVLDSCAASPGWACS
jgi:EAL domain-containing protein (putative c-di-GMP-specific phosphodiesterase class I)